MESWILGIRFVLILYCLIRFVPQDMGNISLVLFLLLLYIILSMLHYLVSSPHWQKILLVLTCVFLISSSIYADPLFFFLLPLSAAELFNTLCWSFYLNVIPLVLPCFLLAEGMIAEYLLAGILSLSIFLLCLKASGRIDMLKQENDRLRERNHALRTQLARSEEYEGQLKYLVQLEERNELAQKIHDRIGHVLAGSLIQLEAATVLISQDTDHAKKMLAGVIQLLKEGMEDIRSTLRNIKPAQEQLGLSRLKAMLDEFSLHGKIKTTLHYEGPMDTISSSHWTIIMENTKEALTNALKYSACREIRVQLEVMNKLIRLEVKDDGIGAATLQKGLGLRGMEERSENAGGTVIFDGNNGFSVITLLPIKGDGKDD